MRSSLPLRLGGITAGLTVNFKYGRYRPRPLMHAGEGLGKPLQCSSDHVFIYMSHPLCPPGPGGAVYLPFPAGIFSRGGKVYLM